MLVSRAPLSFALLQAGAALGALLWILFGGARSPAELDGLTSQLDTAVAALRSRASPPAEVLSPNALRRPLFDLAPGGATADPALTLQGLSLTNGRSAALIGVGSSPPTWFAVGDSRSGVTLRRVDASGVVVETLNGEHSLSLGAGHAAATPSGLPGASPQLPPLAPK